MKSTSRFYYVTLALFLSSFSIQVYSLNSRKMLKTGTELNQNNDPQPAPAPNSTLPNSNSTQSGRQYEPVVYVPSISPAGKAALELQNQGDEYVKLLTKGYETPKFHSQVVDNLPTPVSLGASVSYLWKPNDPKDAGIWQNVEFNRYNNRLLDTTRYSTPAKFTVFEGNTIVHAPSDHGLQIITPAQTTLTPGFLEEDSIIEFK